MTRRRDRNQRPCDRALRALTGSLAALALVVSAVGAQAQALIRDAEIESTLKRIARPLIRAAGLSESAIDILVVNDQSLNAFVIDGRAVFVNAGLLMRLGRIDMLQAVLAHELAHITSGHIMRRQINLRSTNTAIGVGVILGIMAAAAGAGKAAGGIAAGAAGSAMGNFLAHTRAEEMTADQIGVRYMMRAGSDPNAALAVLDIFRGQEALMVSRRDAYARTHPLSAERIRALKGAIAAYGGATTRPQPGDLRAAHARMVAKFRGFIGNPAYILRHVAKSDRSEAAMMTRAIAMHRQGRAADAVAIVNGLIAKHRADPYLVELKGQILLESRQAAGAVRAYRSAVNLAPREPLILAGLGRALLGLRTKAGDREALSVLRRARRMDARDSHLLHDLAVAWAKSGNAGMASLVTAERYALLSRLKDARTNALRAEGLLPRGSAGWLRAQDVIAAANAFLN